VYGYHVEYPVFKSDCDKGKCDAQNPIGYFDEVLSGIGKEPAPTTASASSTTAAAAQTTAAAARKRLLNKLRA
jgi:hypothetical protein